MESTDVRPDGLGSKGMAVEWAGGRKHSFIYKVYSDQLFGASS